MQNLNAFLGIAAAMSLGAASPGPSFVMVARTAATANRLSGLLAALGMGVGGLTFAVASLLGLHGLLLAVPSLYWLLKVAGGLYLAYLGWRIWRGASAPLVLEASDTRAAGQAAWRYFWLGLTTQLSNPKTAIVYASVFAAFLPDQAGWVFNLSVASLVFAIETGWYALVAVVLSGIRARNVYLRCKVWFDRAAGGVMMALGLKLMLSEGTGLVQ